MFNRYAPYHRDKESCPVSLCVFRAPLHLSLHLHAADELTVEQIDKRALALRQRGEKRETITKIADTVHSPANEYGYSCYRTEEGDWRRLT